VAQTYEDADFASQAYQKGDGGLRHLVNAPGD
jgi:hypothetical protein